MNVLRNLVKRIKYYGYVVLCNLTHYSYSYNFIWWCLDWKFYGDGGLGNNMMHTWIGCIVLIALYHGNRDKTKKYIHEWQIAASTELPPIGRELQEFNRPGKRKYCKLKNWLEEHHFTDFLLFCVLFYQNGCFQR